MWPKAQVCGRLLVSIAGSNPAGYMDVPCECCVLLGIVLCDESNIREEESSKCGASEYDLETAITRRPTAAVES